MISLLNYIFLLSEFNFYMRTYFFYTVILLMFASSTLWAQSDVGKLEEPAVVAVEQKPKMNEQWRTILTTNLVYPALAKQAQLSGNIIVNFIVEKDGTLSNISVDSNANFSNPAYMSMVTESIRVVKLIPKGSPAMVGGKPVRSHMRLPVNFKLQP